MKLADIDPKAVAHYNKIGNVTHRDLEVPLFDPENENPVPTPFHISDGVPYFLMGTMGGAVLCKAYYNPNNTWHYTGCSSHSYAFIDKVSDTSHTEKDHRGKYRLEIMVEQDEALWEEFGHSCPKLVGYFDTIGEAMAQAVALNHPDNGVYC